MRVLVHSYLPAAGVLIAALLLSPVLLSGQAGGQGAAPPAPAMPPKPLPAGSFTIDTAEQGRVLEVVTVRNFPQLATLRIRQPRGGEAAINERLRAALLQQLDNHLQCQALVRAQGQFDRPGGDAES